MKRDLPPEISSMWFYGSAREAMRVWFGALVMIAVVVLFALLSR